MKKYEQENKFLFSLESSAILESLHRKKFFSPIHGIEVEIYGTLILGNGSVLQKIKSDEAILYWWQEYEYQKERVA